MLSGGERSPSASQTGIQPGEGLGSDRQRSAELSGAERAGKGVSVLGERLEKVLLGFELAETKGRVGG